MSVYFVGFLLPSLALVLFGLLSCLGVGGWVFWILVGRSLLLRDRELRSSCKFVFVGYGVFSGGSKFRGSF